MIVSSLYVNITCLFILAFSNSLIVIASIRSVFLSLKPITSFITASFSDTLIQSDPRAAFGTYSVIAHPFFNCTSPFRRKNPNPFLNMAIVLGFVFKTGSFSFLLYKFELDKIDRIKI